MLKSYILTTVFAFTLGIYSMSFAYSGGDMGSAASPVLMQFDAGQVIAAPEAPDHDGRAVVADDKAALPSSAGQAAPKPARDEFQRYFDRHYRAHLVLDASAHHFFEVE